MSTIDKVRYQLYRFKYNYGTLLSLKNPVDITLELSSLCNMHCKYCYHADKDPPFEKGFMRKELAMDLIYEGSKLGVQSIKFNYRGESTLNPHFPKIARYAELRNKLLNGKVFIDRIINSNFKFHESKRLDIFSGLCHLTKVKVSFDSFRPELFEKQRAGGNHALTMENISHFHDYPTRVKSGTKLVIQAVRTELNKDEDLDHSIKKMWPDAIPSIRDVVDGRKNESIGSLAHKNRDHSNRKPCQQAFVRLIFTHDGKAHPCCPSIRGDLVMGDYRSKSIKEIFNGWRAKKLREHLLTGEAFDTNPCKTCSSFESYRNYDRVWDS